MQKSTIFFGNYLTHGGKTMAVQVIAAELGLELYRIDLSKMVIKYIGETEKIFLLCLNGQSK